MAKRRIPVSKQRGTPEYKARQERIAKRKAKRAAPAVGTPGSGKPGDPGVPAGLNPNQMGDKIQGDYDIGEKLDLAYQDYLDVADPTTRAAKDAAIQETYNRGVGDTTENLSGRGLTAQGYEAVQLYDVNRARDLANQDHLDTVRRATERYAAIKTGLDNRKTASDLNFAAMAGQNIRAPVAKVPGQAGYTPPVPKKHPQASQDLSQRRPGDTSYVGPTKPGGKSTVYKGKDWSKVASLFPQSQFNVKPMPRPKNR